MCSATNRPISTPSFLAHFSSVLAALKQGPVVGEEKPEFVWHSEGDMLPFAVGEDVLLLGNPLPSDFHTAGEHALGDQLSPFRDGVTVFSE